MSQPPFLRRAAPRRAAPRRARARSRCPPSLLTKQARATLPNRAHNPTNPELLDFADEYGMLMWVENRFINKGVQPIQSAKDRPQAFPPFNAAADPGLLADAQAMVLRDRNHPSVVIWSLSVTLRRPASPARASLS